MTTMNLSPSILLLVAAGAAGLSSVSILPISRGGSVTIIDPAYQIEVVARTGYQMPDGLLWQPDGVYFADEGSGMVQKLVPGGVQRLHFASSEISSPEDVATNGRGDYYFTDDDTGNVWHLNPGGELNKLAGPEQGLRSSEGIAVAPWGDIYVGDGECHCIFKIAPNGFAEVYITGIHKPETLAFDPDGGLYVGDNEEGKLYFIGRGEPRLIMYDKEVVPETISWHNGGLLITDSAHGRVYRWTPGSPPEVIAAFGGNLRRLAGVTADDAGNIWVAAQTSLSAKKGYIFKLTRRVHTSAR
jgi:sugar lactone lactonase YvrE